MLLARRKRAVPGERGCTFFSFPYSRSFALIRGSYFSALLCALERSGCDDAFEKKEAKLTKG